MCFIFFSGSICFPSVSFNSINKVSNEMPHTHQTLVNLRLLFHDYVKKNEIKSVFFSFPISLFPFVAFFVLWTICDSQSQEQHIIYSYKKLVIKWSRIHKISDWSWIDMLMLSILLSLNLAIEPVGVLTAMNILEKVERKIELK